MEEEREEGAEQEGMVEVQSTRRGSRSKVSVQADEVLGMIKAMTAWQSWMGNRKELTALAAALLLLLASHDAPTTAWSVSAFKTRRTLQ